MPAGDGRDLRPGARGLPPGRWIPCCGARRASARLPSTARQHGGPAPRPDAFLVARPASVPVAFVVPVVPADLVPPPVPADPAVPADPVGLADPVAPVDLAGPVDPAGCGSTAGSAGSWSSLPTAAAIVR